MAVGQADGGAAIATADRPGFIGWQIAVLVDPLEIGDLDIGQIRHVAHLVGEAAGDLVQHPGLTANAAVFFGIDGKVGRLCCLGDGEGRAERRAKGDQCGKCG
ncbi:MAG: hypothetical protein E5V72_21320 [Mesorhizobium sp.]|nr:MAG: hypothetical protein E5V72_21320 [Mesorhizobium sp.]